MTISLARASAREGRRPVLDVLSPARLARLQAVQDANADADEGESARIGGGLIEIGFGERRIVLDVAPQPAGEHPEGSGGLFAFGTEGPPRVAAHGSALQLECRKCRKF